MEDRFAHIAPYSHPSEDYVIHQIQRLDKLFANFLNDFPAYVGPNTHIIQDVMYDCMIRVDKRRCYNRVFHHMPEGINEIKVIALYTFWFLKLRPFYVEVNRPHASASKQEHDFCNRLSHYHTEMFCVELLDSLCYKRNQNRLRLKDYIDLEYTLRYGDLSQEAIITLFESLLL